MKIIEKEYNLVTYAPEIAREWNCEKNKGILPEDIFPHSNKKVRCIPTGIKQLILIIYNEVIHNLLCYNE